MVSEQSHDPALGKAVLWPSVQERTFNFRNKHVSQACSVLGIVDPLINPCLLLIWGVFLVLMAVHHFRRATTNKGLFIHGCYCSHLSKANQHFDHLVFPCPMLESHVWSRSQKVITVSFPVLSKPQVLADGCQEGHLRRLRHRELQARPSVLSFIAFWLYLWT